MSKKVKLGLIGLGLAWEQLHGPALGRLCDKFTIKAVCDRDYHTAKRVADGLNLPDDSVFIDYRVMLERADIEAVDLMVPIQENFEVAKTVISSRKNLIAEKPFAATEEGAKELIELAKKNKVKVLVAENIRYEEENVLIKSLIEEKKIGEVMYFIDNHVTDFPADIAPNAFASTEWRQHPDFKGGIFLDSGVHHIARHRFLFGNVKKVYASGKPSNVDFVPYSCINALLTFENHIAGHYAFFSIGKESQAPLVGFRIFGTEGEIYLEDKNCGFVNLSYKDGRHEAIPYQPGEGYYQELVNFYDAVGQDMQEGPPAEIVSSPEKELGDIQVIFDILKAIQKDHSVKSANTKK